MVEKLRKQVIICTDKNCEVEITYSVSDSWLSATYEVVACSAFSDGEVSCEKKCIALLGFIEAIANCAVHKAG